MLTFEPENVREFTGKLKSDLEQCANGEGTECTGIDKILACHADRCREFTRELRKWGQEVFEGKVAYSASTEHQWLSEANQVYSLCSQALPMGRQAEEACYILDGQKQLESALYTLGEMLRGWVTPRLSVGPSARQGQVFHGEELEQVRSRIANLPKLPVDWRPSDARLASLMDRTRDNT